MCLEKDDPIVWRRWHWTGTRGACYSHCLSITERLDNPVLIIVVVLLLLSSGCYDWMVVPFGECVNSQSVQVGLGRGGMGLVGCVSVAIEGE